MIDDLDHIDFYPIAYRVEGDRLIAFAKSYNREGEVFSLCVEAPQSLAGFHEASRILRSWLRGRTVQIGEETYQLTDTDAVFAHPLLAS